MGGLVESAIRNSQWVGGRVGAIKKRAEARFEIVS